MDIKNLVKSRILSEDIDNFDSRSEVVKALSKAQMILIDCLDFAEDYNKDGKLSIEIQNIVGKLQNLVDRIH